MRIFPEDPGNTKNLEFAPLTLLLVVLMAGAPVVALMYPGEIQGVSFWFLVIGAPGTLGLYIYTRVNCRTRLALLTNAWSAGGVLAIILAAFHRVF